MRRSDTQLLHQEAVEALHELELALPCSLMFIKTHNVVHMVDKIKSIGPLYCTSMFPYERSYKKLKAWVKNQAHPEASLTQNIRGFMVSVGYSAAGHHRISVDNASLFDPTDAGAGSESEAQHSSLLSPYQQVIRDSVVGVSAA